MRISAEIPKASPLTAPARSAITDGAKFGHAREADSPLQLRRKIADQFLGEPEKENGRSNEGNSGASEIARYSHDFGRIPVHARQEGEPAKLRPILRGCTGETVRGKVHPVVGIGPAVEAMIGLEITTTNTGDGAIWYQGGAFDWPVRFNTTGRNGWIIQEIVNTWQGWDKAGKPVPSPLTPRYWEPWAVDGAGKVTPLFRDRNENEYNDRWLQPDFSSDKDTLAAKGTWSTTGKLYFTRTDPATQGFVINKATNAGRLPSTTSAPAKLGPVRLHRFALGKWDSTGAVRPTHTGIAFPPFQCG